MSIPSKILVVDDEEGLLIFMSLFLKGMKMQVATALDGAEALEKIKSGEFDLVISDIRMPRLSGVLLYEEAKKFDPGYASRFIFVSGENVAPSLSQAMEQGGCPFLQKPFAGSVLWAAVCERLRAKNAGEFPPPQISA